MEPVGRPPKPPDEKASERVEFRCTRAEFDAYTRKAGRLPLSEWIRRTLNAAPDPSRRKK